MKKIYAIILFSISLACLFLSVYLVDYYTYTIPMVDNPYGAWKIPNSPEWLKIMTALSMLATIVTGVILSAFANPEPHK